MSHPRNLAILGATGSIGCSTLDVTQRHPDRFRIRALSAQSNVERLARQCKETGAELAVVADKRLARALSEALQAVGSSARAEAGPDALVAMVEDPAVDTVMAAIVGAAGLPPTLRAVQLGKRVLLANKEAMVIAGPLFREERAKSGAELIPVDSEHNALFQSLPPGLATNLDAAGVTRLILTASGGPFRDTPASDLSRVTPDQACDHPNWDMGRKISVDSATLMNKGLEVIEARWLFNARPEQIDVVIHPQSIVHSMVAYRDGSVISQMGQPDMRTPIAHALAWPDRIESGVAPLCLTETGALEFYEPDLNRFPCLRLAFEGMAAGGSSAATLNAANEIAVQSFLDGKIAFMDIPRLVESALETADWNTARSLDDILSADREARRRTRAAIDARESLHA